MSGRGQKKGKLKKAREDVAKRDERISEMTQAHRRLQCLYDISKLLTRFISVDRSVPEVIALIAQTLPLRNAILILETAGTPRTIAWQAQREKSAKLEAAKAHAQTAYGYLVRSGVTFESNGRDALQLPQQFAAEPKASKNNFVILPLVVDRGSIFGALQIEGAGELKELDLIFVNAIVNQLAIAIDRQAAVVARQAFAETNEREQHLLADVSALVGATLEYREILIALARSAVPRFADLCLIDEMRDDGTLRRLEVVFADVEKQRDLAARIMSLPGPLVSAEKVAASGRSILVSRTADPVAEAIADDEEHASALRAAGLKSMIIVPLRVHGRTLGVLKFGMAESGRRYSTQDLALAEEIARRAAIAIDNARLYEQAKRATVARENLLAIVSHDLRNPLGVMLMNLAVLLKARGGEERRKARKQLDAIQRSAIHMIRMVEDLLATASIEAGQLSVEQRRLHASPLISEAIDALQPLAARKSLHLVNELSVELPAVHADAARLQQVFANLLGNAIKFTPDGGAITVRAWPSGEQVTFSVSDTGPGIAEDELPHLFDRFWQATRTARLGTGLGLFIVKGIVQAHGGRVWVESKVGEGTTFFFTLPVVPPHADHVEDAVPSNASLTTPPQAGDLLQSEIDKQGADLEQLAREADLRERELHSATESTRVARQLAERAREFRRDFMGVVSHELRGPVTAIELLIERMQRDRESPPTPRQEALIRRMFAAVARLTAIIESLLQHALIQSGRLTTQIAAFDARAVAEAVLEELSPYAESKGLELRLSAASGLPALTSDPVLVRLVLLNLVGNAIKFTERGIVEVSLDCNAGVHRLIVKDSGPGIPRADRVRIFEPFIQMGDAKQKHVPGMGLGLALVREVVDALGGHVDLDSQMGRGSTFTVTLPAVGHLPQEHGVPLH